MIEPDQLFCPFCATQVYPYQGHNNIWFYPCYGCGSVVSFGNPEDPDTPYGRDVTDNFYRRRPHESG